jgi:hypothetical protein
MNIIVCGAFGVLWNYFSAYIFMSRITYQRQGHVFWLSRTSPVWSIILRWVLLFSGSSASGVLPLLQPILTACKALIHL